jgi:hypothetical protein
MKPPPLPSPFRPVTVFQNATVYRLAIQLLQFAAMAPPPAAAPPPQSSPNRQSRRGHMSIQFVRRFHGGTNAKTGRVLLRAWLQTLLSREQMHGEDGKGGGGRCGGGSSLKNLHAIVAGVSHDHAPVTVDGDAAIRVAELPVA